MLIIKLLLALVPIIDHKYDQVSGPKHVGNIESWDFIIYLNEF